MRLGVNIDHIATVRQARRGSDPDPVEAARICERAGAESIVCHLREDRRHIQDQDVRRLRRSITTRLNLEMSVAREIIDIALAVKPDQVTFVRERRQELTTEGGLNVRRMAARLRPLVRAFQARGITVSLFIDPVSDQVRAAHEAGVPMIELHTGRYAGASSRAGRRVALVTLQRSARYAARLGLQVAAGHGLDYDNVRAVALIPEVEELNIGFSIISRALFTGLDRAVRDMRRAMARR